ncbi:hypothetical protein SAMN04488515_1131 [Cognatiyoonia koreensis]|uniref:DUF4345 domain-containing protein n=1 Tax=Cognatiyoonia koreensis TaxID=364200 RepID=A0A1I0PDB7_9RHOB|nr:hypothetical protein SAMN04488515_1131 [Cognatiyoonia koreensis]
MTYRLAASVTALVCVILFPILLLATPSYMGTYGVASNAEAAFMSRRASPMLLGLGVLLWMSRRTTDGASIRAISAGVSVTFAGIAATGIYEFVSSVAHWYILIAAVGELVIAAVFLRFVLLSRD